MSTFILALLLYLCKAAIAEKVFLSLYVLVYTCGFYLLLRKISASNRYWALSVFLFVFTYALSKGFYNFSFGIALWFWMVCAWIRFLDKVSLSNAALFFLFSGLTFFTHLLPFALGAITCGSLLLSYSLSGNTDKRSPQQFFMRHAGAFIALIAPFVFLAMKFTVREGGLQLHLALHPYRLLELVEFKYLTNVVNTERLWAAIAGVALTLLFLFSIARSFRHFSIHKYDGFLLALLAIMFVYTFFPEDFMGRAIIISIRAQLFIYIIIACCIAYRLPDGIMKDVGGISLLVCFIILSVLRISCRQDASAALDEHLSAAAHINQGSVVLPFDFSPNGKDNKGRLIADRNALFHHASQYMGANEPLIILDNYEANMGYFPIRWNAGVNPYAHLSAEAGIEGLPPFARIVNYEQLTGTRIDNILFWCFNPSLLTDARFNELYTEIGRLYHIAYRSPSGRTVLYARNP